MTRKGEAICYFSMSATLATAFGPFIGIYMNQHTSFSVIFGFCLILGIFSLCTTFFLYVPKTDKPIKTAESKGFKFSSFIEPKALPIAIITFVIAFCYSSVLSFINFYAIEIDLVEAGSFFFIVYAIVVLLLKTIYWSSSGYQRSKLHYVSWVLYSWGWYDNSKHGRY